MNAVEQWQPSKFVWSGKRGRWVANRAHVSSGSWYIVDLFAPIYEETVRTHARGRLLDLGCGMVPFYGMYKDIVSENVCIDWANSLHTNPHLDIVADLNEPFPLPDAAFDTVLCSDVLEHIAEPAAFLRETARVLKPGGTLLLMVPFFYWIHEQPHDYYRYTEFALRGLCEKAGLPTAELEAYGGLPDIFIDLVSKTVARNAFVLRSFLSVASLLATSRLCERWRIASKSAFPLGYVVVAVNARGG